MKKLIKKFLGIEELSEVKFLNFLIEIFALFVLYRCSMDVTAFCYPTAWAAVVFIYCIGFYLATFFFDTAKTPIFTGLSFGLLFTTFTYLLLFIGEEIGWFISLGLPLGLLVFHILSRTIVKSFRKTEKITKYCFFVPLVLGFVIAFIAGQEFKKSATIIEQTPVEQYENLPNDFMTEHIVGMHFKYYTKTCVWDGWRPPVHEPLLVMGLWMNNMSDPLQLSLRERVELYIKLFPDKPYKMRCSCGAVYTDDELWDGLPPSK
jgi:hypothetical protein